MAETSRDKRLSRKAFLVEASKGATELSTLTGRAEKVVADIYAVDKNIATLQSQVVDTGLTGPQVIQLREAITAQSTTRSGLVTTRTDLNNQRVTSAGTKKQVASAAAAAKAAGVTTTGIGVYPSLANSRALKLEYNASTVNESYFSSTAGFVGNLMPSSNKPSAVLAATELWSSAVGSKGMIVTSQASLKAMNSGLNVPPAANPYKMKNYGFQFMYNPGTVNMSYYTAPNVDVALMTSGQEMFNLAGASSSQGAVTFEVVINRIADMQYYSDNGTIKDGYSASSLYSKPPADAAEEQEIYNRGTMYDVEYLLRVLMGGTTMKSYLRGNSTADMGWLPAIPVELHLGNKLRYLGIVNSFEINHVIFNERMVPLFSTISITFARLPDYAMDNTGKIFSDIATAKASSRIAPKSATLAAPPTKISAPTSYNLGRGRL